jgi:hypothetical protein
LDTLYWIGLAILFVYSVITTGIIFVMRKDLISRKPKGKLYCSDDEFYCEFNIEMDEIKNSDYITLMVINTNRKGGK